MNFEELRVHAQKEFQRGADLITQGSEVIRGASEIVGQLRCDPEIEPLERQAITFDHLGGFYQPPMIKKNWADGLEAVTGFSDGSFETRLYPTSVGTNRIQQSVRLSGQKTYAVEQTVTLLEPFSWGGDQVGGKLGAGLSTRVSAMGGDQRKDGSSCRFGLRENLAMIYVYHQNRPTKYGEDFDLGPLPIGEPVQMKMEMGVQSDYGNSDGTLRGWLDGELVLEKNDMLWVREPDDTDDPMGIWFLWFSHFQGGNSAEWSPLHDNRFIFENIKHG